MQIVPESDEALSYAIDVLQNGGIVMHATETCYGIACDLMQAVAVQKLFTVKRRPGNQVVSALCADKNMVERYAIITPEIDAIMATHLPGPLTIIMKQREDSPLLLSSECTWNTSIGIRISSHSFASRLSQLYGSPLATTSANIHGKPNPYSASDLFIQYGPDAHIDLLVDGGQIPVTPPSTIIDCSTSPFAIVRQGTTKIDI